jgi:hypothetical protein
MLRDERHSVWSLSPAGFLQDTTEDRVNELIARGESRYVNYIFFFAELLPPEEPIEP